MEFKSEEFLRKVEKASKQRDGENFKANDIYADEGNPYSQSGGKPYNDTNSELEDILLSANSSSQDKKKYIVLAGSLVVLFLIILILIKVFSGSPQDDTLTKTSETISQDKALEGQSIEQEYQRIINERLKKLQEQKEAEQSQTSTQAEQIQPMQEQQPDVQQPITVEEPIKETPITPVKETIKETVKQPIVEKKTVQPEPTPKTTAPKTDTKALFTQATTPSSSSTTQNVSKANSNSDLKGFFIQVGAFSKEPSNNFLNKIKSKGYSYKIFKDNVNGITYNKVLVGPFNSRTEAESNATGVKKALELNSAFILSF